MVIKSSEIPDHIKRLMPVSERKAVLGEHALTTEEAVNIADAKSEKELQEQLLAYLEEHRGIVVFYSRMDRKTSNRKGQPDFLFAFKGIPVAWEVKTPIGKLRPEQEAIAPKLLANGWRYSVVRSVQQAKTILDEL
jgi:hypothetical protein